MRYRRHSLRLPSYNYSQPNAYFVTLCAFQKEHLFGEIVNGEMFLNEIGQIVRSAWDEIPTHFPHVESDEFVVMPNHIHGIIQIVDDVPSGRGTACRAPTRERFSKPTIGSIPTIIRSFKSAASKHIHDLHPFFGPVWQRNYYERIIRSERELFVVRQYIRNNPANWELDSERLRVDDQA